MRSSIKNSDELREFLCETAVEIRYKHLDVDRGQAIAKLAAQVNESVRIEIMANRIAAEMGESHQKFGALPIGMSPVVVTT